MPNTLHRPVFILTPPRAGSTLLFKVLADAPDAWTIGGESHRVIEDIPALDPRRRGFDSNRLTGRDATPEVVEVLSGRFHEKLTDRDGRRPDPDDEPVLLEKTPKNALRTPFFAAAYPDARFIYLYREPVETISSMIEGWRSADQFKTYPDLPDWPGPMWSFLLVPGWRALAGRPVPEIAARQWAESTDILLSDLAELDGDRWCVADYHRLVADPVAEVKHLCAFLDWSYDRPLRTPLPLSGSSVTPPGEGKWRQRTAELEAVMPLVEPTVARAKAVLANRRTL
jgi:hypothetical protein